MHGRLIGEPLVEEDCVKYLGSQIAEETGCERDAVQGMNEWYKVWRALKSVLSNRELGISPKKRLYEGVIVPTALYVKRDHVTPLLPDMKWINFNSIFG